MWEKEHTDRSVIGADLIVNGDISCKSDLVIEGNVEGNVSCTSLRVGSTGKITGDINSDEVLIEGTVHGMVKSGSVELREGCVLEGNISSSSLAIDHGAVFTGSVQPVKQTPPQPKLREAAE